MIIDGRIADICQTGFLEGEMIVANFVLEELRHIADSSDSLKRNRGRGGLDILNWMRNEFVNRIIITEKDYPDIAEVDSKLLKLAQDLHGVVVTNDFNLNKVAQLQGMKVLNINELSNAVKPVVLPGEEMTVTVIKEGKETGQGVAYLDDGTMIVVENGRRYVGKNIQVVVTSILQTAAGRMVFAKPAIA
ncbi:MAG: TRAM domain-containing protein [Clostridiales bacterium]